MKGLFSISNLSSRHKDDEVRVQIFCEDHTAYVITFTLSHGALGHALVGSREVECEYTIFEQDSRKTKVPVT